MLFVPKEQTFCGNRAWAYTLSSLERLLPWIADGVCPLCNQVTSAKGRAV